MLGNSMQAPHFIRCNVLTLLFGATKLYLKNLANLVIDRQTDTQPEYRMPSFTHAQRGIRSL